MRTYMKIVFEDFLRQKAFDQIVKVVSITVSLAVHRKYVNRLLLIRLSDLAWEKISMNDSEECRTHPLRFISLVSDDWLWKVSEYDSF